MIDFALLYGNSSGHLDVATLFASFQTKEFAYFLAFYYAYYYIGAAIIAAIAVLVFKVDYSNIDSTQLRREARLTLESVTTYVVCYWLILQVYPAWNTDTSVLAIAKSYIINSLTISGWFFISHKIWHSNRILYRFVHADHHDSEIVCPLTALSNSWAESAWTAVGWVVGPFVFGANNVWGWYLSVLLILFEAIMGHSRLPFTLEHATHHVAYNKNYGFYSEWNVRVNWDRVFGSWAYSSNVAKVAKVYPHELSNYTWNDSMRRINWSNVPRS